MSKTQAAPRLGEDGVVGRHALHGLPDLVEVLRHRQLHLRYTNNYLIDCCYITRRSTLTYVEAYAGTH